MPVPTPTSSTESPRLDVHLADGFEAAGVERGTEDEVVDVGELLVDPLDEIVLDNRDRERPRRRVTAQTVRTAPARCRTTPCRSPPLGLADRRSCTRVCKLPAKRQDYISAAPATPYHLSVARAERPYQVQSISVTDPRLRARAASRLDRSVQRLEREGEPPRRRRDVEALDHRPQRRAEFLGDANAFARLPPRRPGLLHPLQRALRHRDAGHFVGHELGVQRALERPQPGDDRNAEAARCGRGIARTPRRRTPAA